MSRDGLTPDDLKTHYSFEIEKAKTFKTIGVSRTAAEQFLNTSAGEIYFERIADADVESSTQELRNRAILQLTSGRELPRMEVFNEPLVKIVPRGVDVSSFSPFFTKQSALNNAIASGQNLSDYFGLPIESEAQVYDIYEIKPKGPTEVFINKVAPTSELNGLVTKHGGAEQYLVPNRKLYSDAVRVGSIGNDLALHEELVVAKGLGSPITGVKSATDTPERTTRIAAEPGAPRGPPTVAEAPLAGARTAAEAAPDTLPGTLSPAGRAMLKGAGAAGVALLAYDLATTGHQVIQLRSQGNATGADSAMTHFAGRSVGGIAGGFLLGAGYGAVAGVETGPGMIVTGLVGGVIGAYAGEQWAQQRDNDKIYKQTDANGNQWTRDPDDPRAAWTRTAQTQQLKQAPGQDAQVTARTDADGDAIYRSERYVATGHLARQLNYQSANASYELGLANPQTPRNPYSLPGEAAQQPGWHAGNWSRDAQTGAWSRVLVGPMPRSEFQAPEMQTQAATPQQQAALEAQSRIVIAQNAANAPAAIAARYQIAYDQFGWEHAGPVPEAIRHAAASADTLQASDGNHYTRGTNGEWISDGWLGNAQAQGNIRNELNAVHQSQQAGLADMAAIAQHARAHPQPPQDALRDLVATAYQAAGVARTVAELDAAVAAVRRDHERDGLGNRGFTLRLLPDPAAADEPGNRAIATLATDDDGQMVIRSVTTPQEMRQAQDAHDAPARSTAADTRADAQRDDAASPGMEASNPLQQSRIGQLLDRYFDAAARGDAAALAQTARDYEKTPEYRQWEQWGQDNHQQLQAEQRQLAQQQQSQGRAL